jgi:hypothetical protein
VDADRSLGHLLARLAVVETRVRALVAARRARDPRPDDAYRGLYLSGKDVDRLLHDGAEPDVEVPGEAALRAEAAALADAGGDLRLVELGRAFQLDDTDLDLLLVAIAPDLDARFERLYGYLNDDVTRRRATVGLARRCATASTSATAPTRSSPPPS